MVTFVEGDKFCCLLLIVTIFWKQSVALSSMDSKSKGLQILRQRKADARVNRITTLLSEKTTLSSANQKELANLMNCDTYDSSAFTESHQRFKVTHNNVFAALGIYCSNVNHIINDENEDQNSENNESNEEKFKKDFISVKKPVFYLDGPEGESTKSLRSAGYCDDDLFTANIFESTAAVLKNTYMVQTYHGSAHECLNTVFSSVPFCSYYLDGCSGSSQAVIEIIKSIFTDKRLNTQLVTSQIILKEAELNRDKIEFQEVGKNGLREEEGKEKEKSAETKKTNIDPNPPNMEIIPCTLSSFSIGFTLTNAGGKDFRLLVDRDQEVTKYIFFMGKKFGFSMTYAGDDPESYGLESSPIKREGDVQTTWIVLRR